MSYQELEQAITGVLRKEQKPLSAEGLARRLSIDRGQLKMLKRTLADLHRKGAVSRTDAGKYTLRRPADLLEGIVCGTVAGTDYFMCPALDRDLKIRHSLDAGAMHGDKVLVRPVAGHCQIVQVLQRSHSTIVGTVFRGEHGYYVEPDEKRLHTTVTISRKERLGATEGQKVVVRLTSYPTAASAATGSVIEILGDAADPNAAVLSVLRAHGVHERFPSDVLAEAAAKQPLSEKDLNGRLDLRSLRAITIDGDDAKDLDDAVSLEEAPSGTFLLGVHIADVSHYVPSGSALDREALERGTSVYIPGTVYPMLPPALSNGLCSLNPGEDRLAISCFMRIDQRGGVTEYAIEPSVIKSKERMSYHAVTELLKDDNSPLAARYADILPMLKLMQRLAELLSARRKERGSIDFDIPEAAIQLDEAGHAVSVDRYEITISNSIIEEFMLKANETVAFHMQHHQIPALYRIHEAPSGEKRSNFSSLAALFGYRLPLSPCPMDYSCLLKDMEGKPEKPLLSRLMLRSMSKARYSPANEGHFGLAAQHYLHFTSPIRRYPDLLVHRMLHLSFRGDFTAYRHIADRLGSIAEQCSRCEIEAELTERDVDDLKKADYMSRHLEEEFDGVISGVTAYGLYIELENTVEGFLPVSALKDDYYTYDEGRYCLLGDKTHRRFQLGDSMRVRAVSSDTIEGKIGFLPA